MISPFGHLRALLRLLVLAVSLLILVISWIFPLLLAVVNKRAASHLRVRLMGCWARFALWVMGFHVSSEGTAPEVPFFLVSNHLTYMDILVLWSRVDVYFLAKSELGSWPLLGPLIRAAGTLFINRNRRADVLPAIEKVKNRLALGNGVVFFPEGTSSSGGGLLNFKSSLFEVALHTGLPVHVACLHYAAKGEKDPTELRVCWWGEMGFADHFYHLMSMPGVYARVRFAEEPVSADCRKELALAARARMQELFEPMHDWSRVDPNEDAGIPT
ncbi:MAG: lysophospholipid acyltransferase family protein [Planctomycetota bacterium]|nr:lysophospholipid acyltransferase family protein [Planctomycetota bacterium]MDA1113396.1 lysophospholipid acyltransferase family protein [Planctomycetota bacterium]